MSITKDQIIAGARFETKIGTISITEVIPNHAVGATIVKKVSIAVFPNLVSHSPIQWMRL